MAPTRTEYFIPQASASQQLSFEGSTLILPVVSLANVPQLAVDLLIHGTHLGSIQKLGSLDPVDHIPVVGAVDQPGDRSKSEQTKHQISTPIEVYQTTDKAFTIVQQRSPVIKACKDSHIAKIKAWISAAGFSSVLLLVSVDAATRSDRHLQHPSPFFQFIRPNSLSPTELQRRILARYTSLAPENLQTVPVLSAGGLARRLLAEIVSADQPTEVNALISYVAEGDNRNDAKALAQEALFILDRPTMGSGSGNDGFMEPLSWKAADQIQNQTREDLFG